MVSAFVLYRGRFPCHDELGGGPQLHSWCGFRPPLLLGGDGCISERLGTSSPRTGVPATALAAVMVSVFATYLLLAATTTRSPQDLSTSGWRRLEFGLADPIH